VRHLDEVFDRTLNHTCISPMTYIYNGVLAIEKGHPVLRECIEHMLYTDIHVINDNYGINCANLYRVLHAHGIQVRQGRVADWMFFNETCVAGTDRYNLRCTIADHNGRCMFRTRYDDFPW
jgi:hypothetical protein